MSKQTQSVTVSFRGQIPLWVFMNLNKPVKLVLPYRPYSHDPSVVMPVGTVGILRGIEKMSETESHALVVINDEECSPWNVPFEHLRLVA